MREKRLEEMKGFVLSKQHVTLKQLCEAFEISMNTVRRDVRTLVNQGAVTKVYGGVTAPATGTRYQPYQIRSDRNANEKRRIGKVAASLVRSGDVIAIDTGSTALEVARHIDPRISITVITNNLDVMALRAHVEGSRLTAVGGDYIPEAHGFASVETIRMLETLKATRAFISCTGLIAQSNGITNAKSMETEIKRTIISIASEVYLVADSSKFDVIAPMAVASLSDIDCLVTDHTPDTQLSETLAHHDVECIIA